MLHIGIDDTDSRAGGCTTALARLVPPLFPELREAAPPRLVRLNPNVPWKTRGNGAIAITMTGTIDAGEVLGRVRELVESLARKDVGTSPGVVVATRPLPSRLYDAAVTRIVERSELALEENGALAWGGRGVIGAAAALAWRAPPERTTWERIAYRWGGGLGEPRVGVPPAREVDPKKVRDVELAFPTLFDSYDLVEDDVVCVPSSPCPVLWGLRGTDPDDLARASAALGPQRPVAETLFLTNHASDDHLVARERAEDVRAYESPLLRGRVEARPVERNGHVFVEVGGLRCAAYAPTRSFRAIVAALREGDDITVAGGAHEGPDGRLTVGLEKLCIHEARRKVANPRCPACGRAMKSAGKNAGYRCCTRVASAPTVAGEVGWREVPASARRHLARPLKLLNPWPLVAPAA